MTTHVTTHNPVRSDLTTEPAQAPRTSTSRAWAWSGVVAGLAGIGTIAASGMVDAVYDESLFGDGEAIREKLADQTGQMLAFHTFGMVAAVALVVFAAGLQRRLRHRLGDSIAPGIASAGLLGTALVLVLGTGLDTEFILAFGEGDMVDPANAALYNHWIGTIPWCWGLAGLSALAVFSAYRQGAVPRWIGLTSLVLGGLTVLLGVSPVQYMAGMTAPLWLLVVATGFAVGDKEHRSA